MENMGTFFWLNPHVFKFWRGFPLIKNVQFQHFKTNDFLKIGGTFLFPHCHRFYSAAVNKSFPYHQNDASGSLMCWHPPPEHFHECQWVWVTEWYQLAPSTLYPKVYFLVDTQRLFINRRAAIAQSQRAPLMLSAINEKLHMIYYILVMS